MPYNGSGSFLRSHNWAADKTNSIPVTASLMDDEHDGFATGLSTAICRDGQSTTTARIPFASGIEIYSGGPTAATLALRFTSAPTNGIYHSSGTNWHLVAGGTTAVTLASTSVTVPLPLLATSTLAVTGNAVYSGTLNVAGDFIVATQAFVVDASTGNVDVFNQLEVGGALAVAGTSISHTVSNATAIGPVMTTKHIRSNAGVTNDATFTWDFWGDDTAGTNKNLARFDVVVEDATAAGMDSFMRWRVLSANALSTRGIIFSGENAAISPISDDSVSLGRSTFGWSDLHLALGAVINFSAGNMTITHAAATLVFNGGVVDFNDGITVGGAVTFSVATGTGIVNTGGSYQVDGTQVVGNRNTGWTTMGGATNEGTSYNPASITLVQLAERVSAIQNALTVHGLIGT